MHGLPLHQLIIIGTESESHQSLVDKMRQHAVAVQSFIPFLLLAAPYLPTATARPVKEAICWNRHLLSLFSITIFTTLTG